jgi:DNA-binding IscR family transcriptional regulator
MLRLSKKADYGLIALMHLARAAVSVIADAVHKLRRATQGGN